MTSYQFGFLLSILLTLAAFLVVNIHMQSGHVQLSHAFVITVIVLSAIAQLFVQLFFFLHVEGESKPRWNLTALMFAFIVVFILVGGSLWIMYNLQRNMVSTQFIGGEISPQAEND